MPRSQTTKFSKDDREKYFTRSSFTPGPQYMVNDDASSKRPRSPSSSFSKNARDTGMVMKTPFSGTYYDIPPAGVSSRDAKFDFNIQIYAFSLFIYNLNY